MYLPLLIIACFVVMIVSVVRRFLVVRRQNEVPSGIQSIEMQDVFESEIANGNKAIRIAAIYDQFDLMFIKMLLQNEQIPFFIEFENMSSLKPGLKITTYTDVFINILEKDFDDALLVLDDYVHKTKEQRNIKSFSKIRNICEYLIGGWFVPKGNTGNVDLYRK